MKPVRKHIN